MSEQLDRDSFLKIGRRVFNRPELLALAQHAYERLQPLGARFAYYFNPHLVFTRSLSIGSDGEESVRACIGQWAAGARSAFHGDQGVDDSLDQHLGGVPSGSSDHEEIYFEFDLDDTAYSLHASGQSFRIRITRQSGGSDRYPARILLIQTCYPVDQQRLRDVDPANYWQHVDLRRYPEFSSLQSDFGRLAKSTALPCVVDCFVAYLDHDVLEDLSLRDLAAGQEGELVVANFCKTSVKYDLRTWSQNPVSGEMDPRWAYTTIDRVTTRVDRQTFGAGASANFVGEIYQIELEVGPSREMVDAALQTLPELDDQLGDVIDRLQPVYGRKIHRLLNESGAPMGQDNTL